MGKAETSCRLAVLTLRRWAPATPEDWEGSRVGRFPQGQASLLVHLATLQWPGPRRTGGWTCWRGKGSVQRDGSKPETALSWRLFPLL